ncbi:holliday junction ATP-dependent DNA helicase RuvA [Oxobacter pfennigii]|uniref:Holliday junction branch migration complex subunit RuvA n=1 Tax=Oxobacter pfennigii TaxID=36849 RepID=A0A0P8X2F6_9CLOT|nr:Holliday junction branch migration protein RuvA [Oxobacter pfennigii]KPU44996.1 holliday junction ATP-dependent DNA helicase RuvA [Oxobacter pfennigii]
MFYYIKGVLEYKDKDFIVIDNNGLGLKVFVSASTIDKAPAIGGMVRLFTYFHVREDIMALYGFLSKEELDMFELLISVSGVGPKAGLAVLSALSPIKLGLAIMGGDTKSLTSVSGIGSKTAHRIILELKDKIHSDNVLADDTEVIYNTNINSGDHIQEAIHALISLGYSSNEANTAVRKIEQDGMDTESLIKAALKILMK